MQIKNKIYGKSWAPFVQHNKKMVALWLKWSSENEENIKSNKNEISNLKIISKVDLCKMFNWDKEKKIVTIFLQSLIDGNYVHGRRKLFLDNYTWTHQTIETIKKLKNINWIIRQHPGERRYNSKINFSNLVKKLEKKYDYIRLFPENINPASLKKFTNVAVTSQGSVGLEYPSFGIPTIVSENSYYTNFGFTLESKNIKEYKNLLKNAHKIKKLNKYTVEKAKVLLFIFNILLKNRVSNLTNFLPEFMFRTKTIFDEKNFGLSLEKILLNLI